MLPYGDVLYNRYWEMFPRLRVSFSSTPPSGDMLLLAICVGLWEIGRKGGKKRKKKKRLKWKSNVLFYLSFWKLFLAATGHEPILLVLPFHMPSHAHQEDG